MQCIDISTCFLAMMLSNSVRHSNRELYNMYKVRENTISLDSVLADLDQL
ncbi:hypothetical protein IMZ48_28705 [Candidatus Bathyarchaeota archaeon]|nr:hypothetical protein [Candidatus Bathyarchaeota archaeon]